MQVAAENTQYDETAYIMPTLPLSPTLARPVHTPPEVCDNDAAGGGSILCALPVLTPYSRVPCTTWHVVLVGI